MNPLTNVRNITKLNEREISLGVSEGSSWHAEYKDSAWVFIGGLDFLLTEGDILCVFSQYGEIVNVNLVRDKKTGKSKGYCFLCYEDQRSTNLAVDNFNGIKITGRTIRVDHVSNYRIPKEDKNADLETKLLRDVGCAPEVQRQVVSIIERGRQEESKNAVRLDVKKESSDSKNTATSSNYGHERDERRITEESQTSERKKNDVERKRRKELKDSRSTRPRRSRSPQPRYSSSSSSEQSEADERRRRDRKKSSKHSNDHRRSRKSKRSAKKS